MMCQNVGGLCSFTDVILPGSPEFSRYFATCCYVGVRGFGNNPCVTLVSRLQFPEPNTLYFLPEYYTFSVTCSRRNRRRCRHHRPRTAPCTIFNICRIRNWATPVSEAKMASRISHNNGIKATIVHKWVLSAGYRQLKRERKTIVYFDFHVAGGRARFVKTPWEFERYTRPSRRSRKKLTRDGVFGECV